MSANGEQQTQRFSVMIDGEELIVRGVGTKEYVSELARLINERFDAVRQSQPNLPRHRVATLVAFNLAHELTALRKENEELLEVLEEAR